MISNVKWRDVTPFWTPAFGSVNSSVDLISSTVIKMKKLLFILVFCLMATSVEAAITFVDSDFGADSAASSITLTWPSVQAGDVAIVTAGVELDSVVDWSVTDFTEIDDVGEPAIPDITGAIFYKVCTGSESGNLVVSFDPGAGNCSAAVHVYRGVDTTNPIDVTYVRASHYQFTANDATPTLKPITTVTNGALVFVSCVGTTESVATGEFDPPLNYTLREAFGYPGYNGRWQCLADRVVATAGVETPGAWLHGTVRDNNCETIGYTIALRPAGAPAGQVIMVW